MPAESLGPPKKKVTLGVIGVLKFKCYRSQFHKNDLRKILKNSKNFGVIGIIAVISAQFFPSDWCYSHIYDSVVIATHVSGVIDTPCK